MQGRRVSPTPPRHRAPHLTPPPPPPPSAFRSYTYRGPTRACCGMLASLQMKVRRCCRARARRFQSTRLRIPPHHPRPSPFALLFLPSRQVARTTARGGRRALAQVFFFFFARTTRVRAARTPEGRLRARCARHPRFVCGGGGGRFFFLKKRRARASWRHRKMSIRYQYAINTIPSIRNIDIFPVKLPYGKLQYRIERGVDIVLIAY